MRIFNRIRDQLLREKRLLDYLKYALGEIVLVVLGILIALSINNWNQERIQQIQTCELLSSMESDLREDIKFFEEHEQFYSSQISNSKKLLMDSIPHDMNTDSIYMSLLLWTVNLQENFQSFNKINNLGISHLLDSDELDSAIAEYYIQQLHAARGLMNWDVDQTEQFNEFWNSSLNMELPDPFVQQNDMPYSQSEEVRRAEIIRVLRSIEGRKTLRSSINNKKAIVAILKVRKSLAENLISIIQKQLRQEGLAF